MQLEARESKSKAEPSRAEPSRAEPSRAAPRPAFVFVDHPPVSAIGSPSLSQGNEVVQQGLARQAYTPLLPWFFNVDFLGMFSHFLFLVTDRHCTVQCLRVLGMCRICRLSIYEFMLCPFPSPKRAILYSFHIFVLLYYDLPFFAIMLVSCPAYRPPYCRTVWSILFIFVFVLFICVVFSSVPVYCLSQRQENWQADG